MGNLTLNGATSGQITLAPPSVAGTNTISLPAQTATVLTDSSAAMNIGSGQIYKDASGNVGIGTSSPTGKLHIYNSTSASPAILNINSVNGGGNATGIYFRPYQTDTQAASNPAQASIYAIDNNYSADITFNTKNPGAIGNALAERMRLDANGNLLVGTTSWIWTNNEKASLLCGTRDGLAISTSAANLLLMKTSFSNPYYVAFGNSSATNLGSITGNGSTVAYNTSSDYRLKENVQPMRNALETVSQLNPVKYTWKADGSDGEGFIAHELQSVIPLAVTGEKNAVDADGNPIHQGVDYSKIVVHLVAAMQEQQSIIEDLKARLAVLEAK